MALQVFFSYEVEGIVFQDEAMLIRRHAGRAVYEYKFQLDIDFRHTAMLGLIRVSGITARKAREAAQV